ncbi:MAG: hypothetical protein RIQ81_1037 [Pseudomonadota bacterium]|jgi:hypothetical protein
MARFLLHLTPDRKIIEFQGAQMRTAGAFRAPSRTIVNNSGVLLCVAAALAVAGCKITPLKTGSSELRADEDAVDIPGLENASPLRAACSYINSISSVSQIARNEITALCRPDTFRKLQSKPGQLITLESTPMGRQSRFSYAGMIEFNGDFNAGLRTGEVFCRDFSRIKAANPSAFQDVQDIITSPSGKDGECAYHFIGKSVFFMRPEFEGKAESHASADSMYGVSMNYLTKSISLVKYSTQLSIAENLGSGRVRVYFITTTVSDTKGLHSRVAPVLESKTSAGFLGTPGLFRAQ